MNSYQSPAALTGGLLARKGAAAPSGSVTSLFDDYAVRQPDGEPQLPDAQPRVAVRIPNDTHEPRAKLSVRLDQDRHLRLKVTAAHLRHSSQRIILDALDAYLAKVGPLVGGDCRCINRDG